MLSDERSLSCGSFTVKHIHLMIDRFYDRRTGRESRPRNFKIGPQVRYRLRCDHFRSFQACLSRRPFFPEIVGPDQLLTSNDGIQTKVRGQKRIRNCLILLIRNEVFRSGSNSYLHSNSSKFAVPPRRSAEDEISSSVLGRIGGTQTARGARGFTE
jgi:hypothetical protein